jgi:predicted nucleotidyltransferase
MSRMDVARPYAGISPNLHGEVLSVLAGVKRGLTGREVAALTGRSSHSGVLGVLNRLTAHGLVERVELNRAYLFSLNRDHLAAPVVMALAGLRTQFFDVLRQALAKWDVAPVHASLFGSTARGDGDAKSDIDLFVVRPATIPEEESRWREQLDELAESVFRWTGNSAAILEASETELTRLAEDEAPIVAELRADAIILRGLDVPTLLGEG